MADLLGLQVALPRRRRRNHVAAPLQPPTDVIRLRAAACAVLRASRPARRGHAHDLLQLGRRLSASEARPVRDLASGLAEFAAKVIERPGARWRCEGARDLALKLATLLEQEQAHG